MIILSIIAVTALSVLLVSIIEPALVGNHLVHALGLHKIWPGMFEHPHILEQQDTETKDSH